MVENGEAVWVIIKRTQEPIKETCRLCNKDPEIKNCANCEGKGTVPGTLIIEDKGNDLVLISAPPVDGKKRSSALKKKTPRTATLEFKHIELAYVFNFEQAQERIEEYGLMVLEALAFVGPVVNPCELKENCPFRPGESKHNHGNFAIKPEPLDDPVTRTGRQYDWGRGI